MVTGSAPTIRRTKHLSVFPLPPDLTTDANDTVRPIHDRMPVLLDPKDFDRWLDPGQKDPAQVQGLLRPYPAEEMLTYPVSRLVNDPKHEDPRCLEPQTAVEPEPGKPPKRKPRN
jgi:putative SOS response-associated peptidase YedK